MPKQEKAKVIPYREFKTRLLRSVPNREDINSGQSRLVNYKRAVGALYKKRWKKEAEYFSKRPEVDLLEQGIFSLEAFRNRKALIEGYGLVGFNLQGVEKAGDFKEVQKGIRKAVKEEAKRGLYLAYSSESVEDPMIFRRDRGFWMRRVTFELFEL